MHISAAYKTGAQQNAPGAEAEVYEVAAGCVLGDRFTLFMLSQAAVNCEFGTPFPVQRS